MCTLSFSANILLLPRKRMIYWVILRCLAITPISKESTIHAWLNKPIQQYDFMYLVWLQEEHSVFPTCFCLNRFVFYVFFFVDDRIQSVVARQLLPYHQWLASRTNIGSDLSITTVRLTTDIKLLWHNRVVGLTDMVQDWPHCVLRLRINFCDLLLVNAVAPHFLFFCRCPAWSHSLCQGVAPACCLAGGWEADLQGKVGASLAFFWFMSF